MIPTVERVIILNRVPFFAGIQGEALAEVAAVLEEVLVPAGRAVFQKGDYGNSLYVITAGTVRVHDDDRDLATLGECEIFGEFSALDPEERSATVTAQEETQLLRIDHETMIELMADNAEVMRGILGLMCKRFRALAQERGTASQPSPSKEGTGDAAYSR